MTSPPPNLLLDLPPEIRSLILEDLLTVSRNKITISDEYSRYKLHHNILRVNKQLHSEGSDVLRRQNILICMESPWPEAQEHVATHGRCTILASGKAVESCSSLLSMTVRIRIPGIEQMDRHRGEWMEKFIIDIADLDNYCKTWMYSDLTYSQLNAALDVNLILHNPRATDSSHPTHTTQASNTTSATTTTTSSSSSSSSSSLSTDKTTTSPLPKSIQTRLLTPFTNVKNLHSLTLSGTPLDPLILSTFHTSLATPLPSPSVCLDLCSRLKDAGNASLKASNPSLALQQYFSAFAAMHIIVDGRRRQCWADAYFAVDPLPPPGIFTGKNGSFVRMELRIKLVANTMAALLALREWDEARFWGERSIEMMRESLGGGAAGIDADEPRRGFPAADSWGKIYYRTAVAWRELGDLSECRALLRVAQRWLPNDPVVRKEVADCALKIG